MENSHGNPLFCEKDNCFLRVLGQNSTSQINQNTYFFIAASVLSVLLGLTSSLLNNILLGAAVFPMAKFFTVVTVISGILKSPEVIWL